MSCFPNGRRCWLIALAPLIVSTAIAQGAMFTGLGFLYPDDPFATRARGVSPNGIVVVGQSSDDNVAQGFRWEDGVMNGLGDLPGGVFASIGYATSYDGNVIVGSSRSENGSEAYRWEDSIMVGIGDLPGGRFESDANDVSYDGSVIVGTSDAFDSELPFRWENDMMEELQTSPGGNLGGGAYAVSSDGTIVVGYDRSSIGTEAARWVDGVLEGLGWPPDGHTTIAYGASADACVVVGRAFVSDPNGTVAFIWKEGEGMDYLPALEGGSSPYREAFCVSGDGALVGGTASGPNGFEATIWTDQLGAVSLTDMLETLGVDLTGWQLLSVNRNGISHDGTVIAGSGINPDGITEGWRAVLPPWPVANAPEAPETTQIEVAVYPNPVRERATVRISLAAPSQGRITVSDVLGRVVAVLHKGSLAAGAHSFSLGTERLPAGVYVVRADFGKAGAASRAVTVLR